MQLAESCTTLGDLEAIDFLAPSGTFPGRRAGHIRIGRFLGQGGMGIVYAGFDERLGREVALKTVRPEASTPANRTRLLNEARILSRLDHPNVCALLGVVPGERTDFLVLELIRGASMQEAIRTGVAPGARLAIAEKVAAALTAVHAQGIIHRDVKPENVMLTEDGDVKLLDFGIARLASEEEPAASPWPDNVLSFRQTRPGKIIGTERCMSPEQAWGKQMTVASDLYSLGLLLQELFTGEPAYDPSLSGTALLAEVQAGRTRPVAGVDSRLAALIGELKSLSPQSRPSAEEALAELSRIAGRSASRVLRLPFPGCDSDSFAMPRSA